MKRALFLCLVVACGISSAYADPITIVAFGDSTTAPRRTIAKVYAQRLPGMLMKQRIVASVVNAGVGGSHTGRLAENDRHKRRHALDRFDDDVRGHKPDLVIIQFGWNDSWVDKGETDSRISLRNYVDNLTFMIKSLGDGGSQVVLMTPNRPRSDLAKRQFELTAAYAQAGRDLAARLKIPLVDVWQVYSVFHAVKGQSLDDLLLDDVHPNDDGHQLVAELLTRRIVGMVKATKLPRGSLPKRLPKGYTIPTLDLADQKHRQVIVDREKGQYLGHPTTVLLEDGKSMIIVYPKGHGRGAIVMKRSTDGGLTWSERLPTPKSWSTSRETPTVHRVVDSAGRKRLILFSGLYPIRMSVSEDDGHNWTELKPIGGFGGIVTMGSVVKQKTGRGHYLALFHDDGRFLRGGPNNLHGSPAGMPSVFNVYKTLSTDGGMNWSGPVVIATHSTAHLCEPGAIRSPDGKKLAVLLRENSRRHNSFVIFSDNEGRTWSKPHQLPASLTGDRHTGRYAPDGRLFISFRDRTHESPTKGDWVAWVGTFDDIVRGREGQYRVRLMDNHKGADCAYPAVELLPDGTLVTTTYGHWIRGEAPFIVSVRLKLDELDKLAARKAKQDK